MNDRTDEFTNKPIDEAEEVFEIETFYAETDAEEVAPLRWNEIIGVFCLIVLCDLTIYRGQGFAGYAVLFFVAPFLLWFSSAKRCRGIAFWIVSAMLVLLSAKLIWFGSGSLVALGFGLIVAYAMALAGVVPYLFEALFFALRTLYSGFIGIVQYGQRINNLSPSIPRAHWISIVLPIFAFLIFGLIFIFANPDLSIWFGDGMKRMFDTIHNWILQFSPDFLEVGFWLVVLWIVIGLLRPSIDKSQTTSNRRKNSADNTTIEAPLYPAFRNTLVTVILLFAVYLAFEFKTLWFHQFEKGFYYSGYAHEGAAWLTAALALASITLSLIFRGSIMRDNRKGTLRTLAWLWSIENLLLAASVYNRLFIYIGFNGMTRMRIVGLFGISAVVVGFLVVIWKIVHNHGFLWLVRRHLWTFAISLYLLALTPMDCIIVSYNVQCILNGHLAPSVQMSVQQINSEGILKLLPLLKSDNEIIREGTQALLAEHHIKAETLATRRSISGWTTYQIADDITLTEFRKHSNQWKQYQNQKQRDKALTRFHHYVYQWY